MDKPSSCFGIGLWCLRMTRATVDCGKTNNPSTDPTVGEFKSEIDRKREKELVKIHIPIILKRIHSLKES
jgi:hypothetical protein